LKEFLDALVIFLLGDFASNRSAVSVISKARSAISLASLGAHTEQVPPQPQSAPIKSSPFVYLLARYGISGDSIRFLYFCQQKY
jgi:hypothetical protein